MSNYISIAIVFNLMVYALGIYILVKNGGIKKNLIFGFCMLLFTIYYFITPVYFYSVGRRTIWGDELGHRGVGVNILDFYDTGLLLYGLANLFFILGYISTKSNISAIPNQIKTFEFSKEKRTWGIIISFVICFSLVLYNFINDGLDLVTLLFGSKELSIAGMAATSNYLKNFSDSLIAILIMARYYKVSNKIFIPMIILSFILFVLMGFRYRVILSILGIAFCSLYQKSFNKKQLIKMFLFFITFLYLMFFITYNRWRLSRAQWSSISYNPAKFEYQMFFEQTRGMLDDITIIKYYYTNPDPKYDYGVTFLYFLVRLMPRAIVGDEFKDSFYPFPAYPIMFEAYDVKRFWGSANTGEAPLHLAYFYIAYGIYGLLILSFLTGRFINWFKRNYPFKNNNQIILHILLTCAFFQWITRGYFPGFVDHLGFMLIGFFMVNNLSKFRFSSFNKKPTLAIE